MTDACHGNSIYFLKQKMALTRGGNAFLPYPGGAPFLVRNGGKSFGTRGSGGGTVFDRVWRLKTLRTSLRHVQIEAPAIAPRYGTDKTGVVAFFLPRRTATFVLCFVHPWHSQKLEAHAR